MNKRKPEFPDPANLRLSEKLRDLLCSCWNPASERPTILNINEDLRAELVAREVSEPLSSNGCSLANIVDRRVQMISLTPTEYTTEKQELEKGPLFENHVDSSNPYTLPSPLEGFYDQQTGMFTPSNSPKARPQPAIARYAEFTSGGRVTPLNNGALVYPVLSWATPQSKELEVTKHIEDLAHRQGDNIVAPLEMPTVLPDRLPLYAAPTPLSPESPVFVPRMNTKAQSRKLSIDAEEFRPTKSLRASTLPNPTTPMTSSTPATPDNSAARQRLLPRSSLNANANEFTPIRRNRSPLISDRLSPVL
ncbi:hypothetical protein C0992_002638 [Termitomyces sp. T32_za158]|nr:hypothetical protein C0992_002638 [Termitomyces sp. T32_za158]